MAEPAESPQDYRLTTAEILYCAPDFPELVQTALWQALDRVPDFPKLNRFLAAWERTPRGRLHSVRIGYIGLLPGPDWGEAESLLIMQ